MNVYAHRIEQLRSMMRSKGWDAVIFTGSDPHNSEYPAPRWKQVEWLSGFTGEDGDLVITLDHAGLWTDTRYFIQANIQLEGSGVVLHKTRVPEQVLIPEWIEAQSSGNKDYIVALDGLCVSTEFVASLGGVTVVSVPDLLSLFWKDRPQIPQTPVYEIISGEDRNEKIAWLREVLSENGCDSILLTALDDIAWMLNVRASDIEYNPLSISYLLITREKVQWFVLKQDTVITVDLDGVEILPYESLQMQLNSEAESLGCLWTDSNSLNYEIFRFFSENNFETVFRPSPVQMRKAVKNDFEIRMMKESHLRDAIAMEKFLYWLEKSLENGETVSEKDAADYLELMKNRIGDYMGDSFQTISAYGKSAALPHYTTPSTGAPILERKGLYLCDAGGQYLSGTTDITRTIPLGECTPLEKEDYTLVLKGHIGLASAVFPSGTAGCQIDALARIPLWRNQRNFGHGTGHGVGFFLGCHEGPQNVRQNFNSTPLLPGMVISDEPGIYREGLHGVRHENLLLVCEAGSNEFGYWLKFEPLTMCHFDTSIIDSALLNEEEKKWLNAYNASVFDNLSPYLNEEIKDWLAEKTKAIQ